jgi:hypothetical protein
VAGQLELGGAEEAKVARRSILLIALHGVVLVVLGMLVGLPFSDAITAHSGADVERAWRVAHTSLVTGGTLYIAIAAIAHYLVVSKSAAVFVTWSLVISAYAFAFALVVGPIVGARGLEPTGPPLNVLVFAIFVVALVALFLSVVIVL